MKMLTYLFLRPSNSAHHQALEVPAAVIAPVQAAVEAVALGLAVVVPVVAVVVDQAAVPVVRKKQLFNL